MTDITGKRGTVTRAGTINGQTFGAGDYVYYGKDSILLLASAEQVEIARKFGTEIHDTAQEVRGF